MGTTPIRFTHARFCPFADSVHKVWSQQAHVSLSHPYIYRISTE